MWSRTTAVICSRQYSAEVGPIAEDKAGDAEAAPDEPVSAAAKEGSEAVGEDAEAEVPAEQADRRVAAATALGVDVGTKAEDEGAVTKRVPEQPVDAAAEMEPEAGGEDADAELPAEPVKAGRRVATVVAVDAEGPETAEEVVVADAAPDRPETAGEMGPDALGGACDARVGPWAVAVVVDAEAAPDQPEGAEAEIGPTALEANGADATPKVPEVGATA